MKYLACDIGNVLCECKFDDFLNLLSKSLNITLEDAKYFMNRTQKLHDLGYTVMADELRDHFKIKSSVIIDELLKSWSDSIKPDFRVTAKLKEFQDKDIKIALLSNIGLEHAALLDRIMPQGFLSSCITHFSCFVGARKPSLIYYQSFLSQYPEFKGCHYIDDLEENLEASRKFGFQPIHFKLEDFVAHSHYDSISKKVQLEMKMKEIRQLILTD
jgi:FMN phosphatase YigB (HAD superfamily)